MQVRYSDSNYRHPLKPLSLRVSLQTFRGLSTQAPQGYAGLPVLHVQGPVPLPEGGTVQVDFYAWGKERDVLLYDLEDFRDTQEHIADRLFNDNPNRPVDAAFELHYRQVLIQHFEYKTMCNNLIQYNLEARREDKPPTEPPDWGTVNLNNYLNPTLVMRQEAIVQRWINRLNEGL